MTFGRSPQPRRSFCQHACDSRTLFSLLVETARCTVRFAQRESQFSHNVSKFSLWLTDEVELLCSDWITCWRCFGLLVTFCLLQLPKALWSSYISQQSMQFNRLQCLNAPVFHQTGTSQCLSHVSFNSLALSSKHICDPVQRQIRAQLRRHRSRRRAGLHQQLNLHGREHHIA